MTGQTIFVLGGGNALGAYAAGAYEALSAAGIEPDWLVGASIGALTGAIIAGNRPEDRVPRLREFWAEATQKTGVLPFHTERLRRSYNSWHALWSLLGGRPTIFEHRWPGLWSALPGVPPDVAVLDHRPLRATLARLVDLGRLNGGEMRFTVCCIDVETGAEVHFDTKGGPIELDHLLASGAMMPTFPPVPVEGRLLCDPGFVNNTPVDVALGTPPSTETLCVALELFGLPRQVPHTLDAVIARAQDLVFASQTRRTIAALRREYDVRAAQDPTLPPVRLLHLAYQAPGHELAAKTVEFSPASITDRWNAGHADATEGLAKLQAHRGTRAGLTYVPVAEEPGDIAQAGEAGAL